MTQQQIIKRPNRTRNQGLDLRSPATLLRWHEPRQGRVAPPQPVRPSHPAAHGNTLRSAAPSATD